MAVEIICDNLGIPPRQFLEKPKDALEDQLDQTITYADSDDEPSSDQLDVTVIERVKATTAVSTSFNLIHWIFLKELHPRLEAIIYWRSIFKSGLIFMLGLIWFLTISRYSLITVISHMSLVILATGFVVKVFNRLFGRRHVTITFFHIDNLEQIVVNVLNATITFVAQLRDIIFVKNIFTTLEFGLIVYIWTYLGVMFDGFTLILNIFIGLFVLPKACELLAPTVRGYQNALRQKVNDIKMCFISKICFWRSYA